MGQHRGHCKNRQRDRARAGRRRVRHHPVRTESLRWRLHRSGERHVHFLTRLSSWSQAAVCLAFFMAAAAPVSAGSFMVSPVRVTLGASQPVTPITVRNESQESTGVQVDAVAWTQRDGADVYTATREILATPPIFTLKAGASQIVRIGLRRDADPARELAYRVFLQEVPPPPKAEFKGLRVALRMGIPVFVVPPTAVAPVLQWRAQALREGGLNLSLRNDGNAHIQMMELRLAHPAE